MADTLGSLIDKLFTIDTKMWNAQEVLYKIRKMTYQQFLEKYYNQSGMEQLWQAFKAGTDLNIQRNVLIDQIDQIVVNIVQSAVNDEELNGKYIQRKHKTY